MAFTRPTRATGALVAILTCQLMVVLDATIVNIALPRIHYALGFNSTDLSWVLNAYTLSFGGLLLLGARAGDLFGRRRVFLAGIALFILASVAGGLATSPSLLLAARAVQGVGGALAAPSALALLMITFSEGRERTQALASYTAVSIGGSAVGLVAGGLLTQYVSWRWVFFVNVPIGIAVILLARVALTETERKPGRVDIAGALTSTVGMSALVFGLVRAASDGWANSGTIASFVVGVVLLVGFVLAETRASVPIIPLRLFANRNRASSYLTRLMLVGGTMGMFFFLTQFLQTVLHYSPLATGLAFLPLTVALFAASQLSARALNGRVPAKVQILSGLVLSAIGMLALTQVSQSTSYLAVLASLLLFGAGNGLAFVPLTTMSLAGVDPGDAGAASGLVNVAQQVGGSLGLAILVSIFGAASRSEAEHLGSGAPDLAARVFVSGVDRAFWASAVLVGLSVLLVATMRAPATPGTARPPTVGSDTVGSDTVGSVADVDGFELRPQTA